MAFKEGDWVVLKSAPYGPDGRLCILKVVCVEYTSFSPISVLTLETSTKGTIIVSENDVYLSSSNQYFDQQ